MSALPPFGGDEPPFGAPWQAQAFAMVLQLHQGGVFTWSEWAQALAEQVRSAPVAADRADEPSDEPADHPADAGDLYYRQWLAALEALLAQKGVASAPALAHLRQRWADAAARTPHGQAIELG